MIQGQEQPKKKKKAGFNHSLRMVAGLYLMYTAVKMFISLYKGEALGVHPVLAAFFALFFLVSGSYIAWKSYKAGEAERLAESKAGEAADDESQEP